MQLFFKEKDHKNKMHILLLPIEWYLDGLHHDNWPA